MQRARDQRTERIVVKTHQSDQSFAECQKHLLVILNRTSRLMLRNGNSPVEGRSWVAIEKTMGQFVKTDGSHEDIWMCE